MDDNIAFGLNLKELRKKMGYTRGQLAQMISYSEKSIEKWEMGGCVPPVATICRLAELFGVTVDNLIFSQKIEIKYLLGIDGGGTKTEFLLTDLEQNEVGRVILGSSNPVDKGMENTRTVLEQGIGQICKGINLREISVFAGLAGGITADNQSRINKFLSGFGFGLFANGSDTDNALEMALGREDGIAVIMGTGIIAFSQTKGERHRIGGWGYLIDKGGSGYNFGVDAMESALRSLDGRGGSSLLLELVEGKLNKSLPASISDIHSGGKTYIASFAQTVFEAFEKGDKEAERIIDRNVKEVAGLIQAGREFLDRDNQKTVICGGLCHQEEILRPFFLKYLGAECPLSFVKTPMVGGAVSLAQTGARLKKT